jgi:ribosomal protein S18 acetylase RimI-like enzyme
MEGTGLPGAIRRARTDDIDPVMALWVEVTHHHAQLDGLFRLRDDAGVEIRRLLEALLRNPAAAIFVCESREHGSLEGMCIVRVDRAPPILQEVERAEITDLGVRSDRRRCGVGRALAERALDWVRARGVERVEVRVVSSNAEGQAFWRSLGYADLMDVLHKRL